MSSSRERCGGWRRLRPWTVVLDDPEQVAAVRLRAQAGGVEVADHDDGFLVRDPWGTGVPFRASGNARR